MKQYILDQKNVLPSLIENRTCYEVLNNFKQVQKIVIAASGSSKNVAMVVQALLSKDIEIVVDTPFQLIHNSCQIQRCDCLIAISQTGKSTGTMNCAKLANENHIPTIAITADIHSPLALECSYTFDIHCLDETIGPKTKGYTATLLVLFFVIAKLINKNIDSYIKEFLLDIEQIENIIKQTTHYVENHREWSQANCVSVIGCGVHYGTACEGNLKLLETMQIPAMCYELEEFMHGPHRTVHENSYLVFIHTHNEGYDMMSRFIDFAHQQKAHIIVIDDDQNSSSDIIIPQLPLIQSVISATVVLQVMSSLIPEYKGINPSDPVLSQFATTVGTRVK